MRVPSFQRKGARRHSRHTWAQRLTIAGLIITAFSCFVASASFGAAQWVLSNRKFVAIPDETATTAEFQGANEPVLVTPDGTVTAVSAPSQANLAEPAAANFLVVGADNNDCAGQNDPTVGKRGSLGERSDTIMIWRANPKTNQLAVLSFPRDLYVSLPGGRKGRINEAFERNDPRRLIATIDQNFGVPVDHYVQVDFCAFRELVDAIGGVGIPFEYPARDTASGLVIYETGCQTLDGSMGLNYVRSRHYQYQSPDGKWHTDPSSDFGRIARQQDFLRRVVAKVINNGLYSPDVAGALITTNQKYLVTDSGFTATSMLEFANTLRNLDPTGIQTYRIESSSKKVGTAAVEIPRTSSDNMKAILAVFRGEALIADAPEQVIGQSTTAATSTDDSSATEPSTDASTTDESDTSSTDASSTDASSATSATADSSTAGATTTTLPAVTAESNTTGYVPDPDVVCP